MSLSIAAITVSNYEEYFDKELKVENAVVLVCLDPYPDKYIIASRINSGF